MAGKRPNDTRDRIKAVAQQLIAEHGVDGIAIRDIITGAGQRNMASLYYYFRSKEELIKEIIVDTSELMEGTRADYLARLEEIGEPLSVRQIVHVLVSGAKLDPAKGGRNATVMRFIGSVTQTHRHLLVEAIGDKYNRTYKYCLELLRRQLTHIPLPILNQRLLFLSDTITSLLSARETALASEGGGKEYWSQPGIYLNMLDFMCGGLQAPVTTQELCATSPAELNIRHFSAPEEGHPDEAHPDEEGAAA
jgi:AcrR family transcriptional regulator